MNLNRFILEVRPKITYHVGTLSVVGAPPEVSLLCANRDELDQLRRLAPVVPHGSAIVLVGATAEEIAALDAEIGKLDFRLWHKGPDFPGLPAGAQTWIKSHYDGGTYSTHLPYLLEAVRLTTGPVLELGMGEGSTPALHDACRRDNRLLVSVESDQSWFSKFAEKYSHKNGDGPPFNHVLRHMADPSEALAALDYPWGVVFVDHSPGSTRRRAVELARTRAEYICVHDSEELGYGLEGLLSSFKYRQDFRYARPWTTVVSDVREIFPDPRLK